MKILMVSERFLPELGGVEIFMARLATALIDRGHEIVVVTSRPGLRTREASHCRGVSVYRFPFLSALRSRDYRQVIELRHALAALKREIQPDLVHLNTSGAALEFHLLTRRAVSAASVVTVHWLPNDGSVDADLCRRALAAADWIVAVTRGCRQQALDLAPAIGARTSVIYNSLPPAELAPAPLDLAAPHLLCLGRLETQKGFDVAIRALAAVRTRVPAARMTIAGDGAQRQALECLAAELGLTTAVCFTGWVEPEAVPALINAHAAVLMPSRYEPFGLVALQAAQMGRPLIGARIPGLSEVVRDGDTGVLCEPDDAAALAAGIASVLERPAAAARMGRRARAHVEEAFGWGDHVNAYETLFHRINNAHANS